MNHTMLTLNLRGLLRCCALAGFSLLAGRTAQAAKTIIDVPNGSFESQIVASYTYGEPPGWKESTLNGTDSFTENIPGFNSTGTNHEGLSDGGAVWIDLTSTTLLANRTYSLIVGVGNRDAGNSTTSNASTFKLQLNNGGSITTLSSWTVNAGTQVPAGKFRNFNTTYTAPSSVPAGTLRIRLQVDSADRAHFDNVQLVVSTPEAPYPGFTDSRQSPPGAQEPVPAFDSRPTAPAVLLLDFDGASLDPMWEWNRGQPLTVPSCGLTTFEMLRACETVKEDFLPFNVSVTTSQARYDAAPPGKRMRCIITPANHWLLEELGFDHEQDAGIATEFLISALPAYQSFAQSGKYNPGYRAYNRDVPIFVFTKSWAGSVLQDSGLDVGRVITHELGHTFGLVHDKKSGIEYYEGQGPSVSVRGPIALTNLISMKLWSPIMGRYGWLTQWSRGEYSGAVNDAPSLQDDVQMIATVLGDGLPQDGYAGDDFGDYSNNGEHVSVGGNSINANGVLGRTPGGDPDQDWMYFDLPARALVRFTLKASEPFSDPNPNTQMEKNLGIANLAARLDIRRANGTVLVSASASNDVALPASPTAAERLKLADALRSKVDVALNAGTWQVSVSGIGYGDPATTGYSEYGSMGAWSLDATIIYYPEINSALTAGFTSGAAVNYTITATNSPTSFTASGLPAGLVLNTSTGVISGTSTAVGTYSVGISAINAAGSDARTLILSIRPTLAEAVDAPALTFTGSSSVPWFGQTAVSFDTIDAAQSGPAGNNQNSFMQTSVTGPGNLSFWWKVDSEAGADLLEVRIDGVLQTSISGQVNWVQKSYSVTAGVHFFSWTYQKDSSASTGADAGWVDQVVWTPSLQAPVITNPTSITWTVGSLISYPITATNSPTSYGLTFVPPATTLPAGLVYSAADHLILGYPQRAGTVNVTLSATNSAGTGQQNLAITVETAFAKWARDKGLAGANAAALADPDRDGRPNLLEMAFNYNPNVRDPQFTAVFRHPSLNRLTASFVRMPGLLDIGYEVQVSDNLSSWTTIASSINGNPMVSSGAFSVTDPGGTGPVTVTVVDNVLVSARVHRYMRVKVSQY